MISFASPTSGEPMKTTLTLFLVSALCFLLASCASPAETGVAISATVGAALAFVDAIQPLLTPEQLAKLQTTAGQIDGTVQATSAALSVVADSIAAFKAATQGQLGNFNDHVSNLAIQVAALPGRTEMLLQDAGVGSAAVGASRALSHLKHSRRGS